DPVWAAPDGGTMRAVCAARPRDGFSATIRCARRASIRVLWRGRRGGGRYAEAPLPPAPVLPRGEGSLAYCLHPVKCPGTSAIGLLATWAARWHEAVAVTATPCVNRHPARSAQVV